MSANLGTLSLPVRRFGWKGLVLAALLAAVLAVGGFAITQAVSRGSSVATKEAPASVAPVGGIENPSLYGSGEQAAPVGGIENPSLYDPPAAGQSGPVLCAIGRVGPC